MHAMPGIDDYQFQPPGSASSSKPPDRRPAAAIVVVLIVAAAIGGYLWFRNPPSPASSGSNPAPPAAQAAKPDAGAPFPNLPQVEDSDTFVRERFAQLSKHPLLAAWLKTTGLVRNLVVVLENASRGLTPSPRLRQLRPAGQFRVLKRADRIVIDPRNYERFTDIADAAASIDAAAAARLYAGLKPLLQMAYDELGNEEPIDRALERAMTTLLSAPTVDGEIRLEVGDEGIGYVFANPTLEALPGAQKQLIRMGPQNQRVIQSRLRQFALAAGLAAGIAPVKP